jgi:CRP/FNR family transcriptional regulator, cyclic AMP receptor protein
LSTAKKITKDNYLFREGDTPDAMYIIKSGEFAITKTKGSSEIILAEIGTGSMVGEMAIFDKKPRSANVKATKDAEVIILPYEALNHQLDSLPVWVKAILRTMNENLREANKKIKILENTSAEDDRYPPHVITRLLSIISFVGLKYGTPEGAGLSIPANRLRNYTIQVFQEATNKMDSMLNALKDMGFFQVEDLGEGRRKIVNLNPDFLFEFVDWYNEWLFKQDKDKVVLSEADTKLLDGVLKFAAKVEPDANGLRKISLSTIQNDSMKELGFLIKQEEVQPLIEKKLVSDKIMEAGDVFIGVKLEDLEKPATYWKVIWDFKRKLR